MDAFESTARAAVAEAGVVIRAAAGRARRVEYKGAVDLVTETDREVEALVVQRLRAAFPEHAIVAEEATAGHTPVAPPATVLAWYLDPLDGTTNFAHGVPHFAVSLALAQGSELLLGVVHDPLRNETFFARRGGGASLNGEPIHVSSTDELNKALLATGFPYDRQQRAAYYVEVFKDFIERARDVRRIGSAALDLCYVACGRFEAFWEWHLHPWDTAAGALIVREAGGLLSDFSGNTFDLFGTQTLASNGRLHAQLVEVLSPRATSGT